MYTGRKVKTKEDTFWSLTSSGSVFSKVACGEVEWFCHLIITNVQQIHQGTSWKEIEIKG